jgi:hypothetical protein
MIELLVYLIPAVIAGCLVWGICHMAKKSNDENDS